MLNLQPSKLSKLLNLVHHYQLRHIVEFLYADISCTMDDSVMILYTKLQTDLNVLQYIMPLTHTPQIS